MFHVKVAKSVQEAKKLLEVGFEYVKNIGEVKLFRKKIMHRDTVSSIRDTFK